MEVIYQLSCPSCGGDIKRSRLINGLHCDRCDGKGGLYAWRDQLDDEYEEFLDFLKREYGVEPWGPQKTWIRWALSGSDLIISAPTGMGKSTTLLALASYASSKGKKVLYIVPSRTLVKQVREKARGNIVVTTMAKVMKNTDEYTNFDLVIVDDVDAALKSPKSVEAIMSVLGMKDLIRSMNELVKKFMNAKDENDIKEFMEGLKKLKETSMAKKRAQLIFASASTSEGNFKAKLMLSIIGVKPAPFPATIRNVSDCKKRIRNVDDLVGIVKSFIERGFSGIVFVHEGGPLEEIANALKEAGIKVGILKSGKLRDLKAFEEGELQVLVAYAARYGVLARGIDMPERIRFAVFYEPPHKKVSTQKVLKNPFVAAKIAEALGMGDIAEKIYNRVRTLSRLEITLLINSEEEQLNPRLKRIRDEMNEYANEILNKLDRRIIINNMVVDRSFTYRVDVKTYIQASGRTSRLTREGFTHGVSVVAYTDDDLMQALESSLRKEFCEGITYPKDEKKMFDIKTALMVVESPTKARTISSFNGGGSILFEGTKVFTTALEVDDTIYFLYILASRGHVYDLTLDDVGKYGILIEGDELVPVYAPIWRCERCKLAWSSSDGTCPKCGSRGNSSIEIIRAIQKISSFVDEVILASDPDEEGEKIAWDIMANVKPFNSNVFRIKYNEITVNGILKAFKEKGLVDEAVVMAQILRRMDDRLVGFSVSEELWRYLGTKNAGLGRVQGPVLNMLVMSKKSWYDGRGYMVTLKLENGDILKIFKKDKEEAMRIASLDSVKVTKVRIYKEERNPLPPFTTDTLLEEADKRLKLDASTTMKLAQDLFEMGFITYHRTDSTRVSDVGIQVAKEWISERFGEQEFVPRRWGEGGAHEAIRPTKPIEPKDLCYEIALRKGDKRLCKLYEMIFKRFMASQMRNAEFTVAEIEYEVLNEKVRKRVYIGFSSAGWVLVDKPKVANINLNVKEPKVIWRKVSRTSKNPLPTLSMVIRWMKENGIGRPSTYARTIESLRRHGFVLLSPKVGALVATSKGEKAVNFVRAKMPELLSVEYTRDLEDLMELVKEGNMGPLHEFKSKFMAIA